MNGGMVEETTKEGLGVPGTAFTGEGKGERKRKREKGKQTHVGWQIGLEFMWTGRYKGVLQMRT